jgi:RimJ/RimL family protein N-acetyltransferase
MTINVAEATKPSSDGSLTGLLLRDDIISIGSVRPDDLGAIFTWLNDTGAAKLDLAWRPLDHNALKNLMDRISGDAAQALFAIRRIGKPEIIGYVMLKDIQPVHRSTELTIRIGAEVDRGRGIGRRAVMLALDYAWRMRNLHRVSLATLTHNKRAIASYKAAGFKEEGYLRQARYMDGKWCDVIVMAALRSDWAGDPR